MINYRDKLERSVSLIPAAAALSAEDRAALVKALETLVGQHSNKLESPELKKRIEALTEIQRQLKDLETNFFVERAALKAKQKRFQEEGHDFRLYTLKNNEVLAKEITEHDEEAFKYLSDIKCCRIGSSNGFKMEFIFNPNPYFENSVLKKTYHMTNDNKPILEKAIGTEIKWYPGKIFAENCRSFFNFFQPLQAADVQSQMHRSYDIFSTIRDEIIPLWHQVNGKKNSHNSYNYGGHQEPLEIIFLGERAVLEGKYQKLYEPLYEKRYEIVNGITEVQETKSETAVDQEGGKATEEKGVPYFWVTAMKNDEVLGQKITKSDDGALKYLKEIKWCRIDNSKGFKLEFFFHPNPYFKNTVLTKAYHMSRDSQMLEKTTGTNINWHPGKSLTPSLLKKPRKRSKNAEFLTKQQSFFNFFNTPEYPGFPWDSSTYTHHDNFQKIEDQFEVQRDLDYEVGKTIRDRVIPHAVSLFTGEAVERGTYFEDLDDDDDLNDDDYYSDDDDEEEGEAVEQDTKFRLFDNDDDAEEEDEFEEDP
ncbi:nucleosome assembly protein 1;2-like isoform X1 [Rosa rugosa]|uniref:nucleosome assembly protein 1;2-like isoform X1 n=1 Tax=Rosa rugosa TaxID=74645 RepID=UPI002B40DC1F|nr:nucleosome assembly protein 1;2-like isoform X1 [Rosa rugosa]